MDYKAACPWCGVRLPVRWAWKTRADTSYCCPACQNVFKTDRWRPARGTGSIAATLLLAPSLGLALGGLVLEALATLGLGAVVGAAWLLWPRSTKYLLATAPGWRKPRSAAETAHAARLAEGTIPSSPSLRVQAFDHRPGKGVILLGDILEGSVTVGMTLELADGASNLPGTRRATGHVESAARNKNWVVIVLHHPAGASADHRRLFSAGTILSVRKLPGTSSGVSSSDRLCA